MMQQLRETGANRIQNRKILIKDLHAIKENMVV
jgi:hypothetical protein